jgi:membrane protein DedA with SNARE-associated domain
VAEWVWDLLNSAASSGALWLSAVLILALLGELGLPFTCPVIEGLLVFEGFRLEHGSPFVVIVPFLLFALAGRFLGAASAYEASGRLGMSIMSRYGERLKLTPERVDLLSDRLAYLVFTTIFLARFTPGFTVLTSFLSGVSHIDRKKFLASVAAQVLVWEGAFLTAGALGGAASRSIDPSDYPRILAIIIGIAIGVSLAVGYVVLRRALQRTPASRSPTSSAPVSHAR